MFDPERSLADYEPLASKRSFAIEAAFKPKQQSFGVNEQNTDPQIGSLKSVPTRGNY